MKPNFYYGGYAMRTSFPRRLLAIALCLLTCATLIFVSCNEPDDPTPTPDAGNTNPTYTVTVKDANNSPVEGATVEFYVGNTLKKTGTTNANGVCAEQLEEGLYLVKVSKNGYTADKTSYFFAGDAKSLSATLTANASAGNTTYTITVVDQNNAPVKDVVVQLCVGEICQMYGMTDANGVSVQSQPAADYQIKLTIPGYTIEPYYAFPAGETSVTIQITATAE